MDPRSQRLGQLFAETDEQLLGRVAQGDRQGIEELYYRHGRALLQYLVELCGERHAAEEVLQDTLAAVWRGAGAFSGDVRTWLFGIARRQAQTSLRRARLLR